MLYIYKIFGKLSIVFYIFMLYQLWHLCQYGGLHSHFPKIVVGMCAFVVTFLLWLITRAYYKKATSENTTKKKMFYIEIVGILLVTLFFGGRIVYSAIPYHGALSWKVDEWSNKKEIPLEHNNLYKTGVEGILEMCIRDRSYRVSKEDKERLNQWKRKEKNKEDQEKHKV